MNYEAYPLTASDDSTRFLFKSIGKRGIFEKILSFRPLSEDVQNLALLDYDPVTGEENDLSVTDIGDMPEIMAMVIKAVDLFFDKYPNQLIYFKGSTKSRTRLY